MNFRPEQKLSSEELKRRNGADLMMAMDTDRQVTLTEKNWTAVINILRNILEAQGKTDKHLDTLLTHLIERIESRNGVHTIEAAAALGMGSREYELIEVE